MGVAEQFKVGLIKAFLCCNSNEDDSNEIRKKCAIA